MTALAFTVLGVEPDWRAAQPTMLFRVRATESTGAAVHAVALRCQLQIQSSRRAYSDREVAGLADLFGSRDRWSATVKPLLWTQATAMLRGFTGSLDFDLPVACSYDLEVAAGKYFNALADGDIPLLLLFSGTLFTRGGSGFSVEQVPWNLEAPCRLPVATWRSLMERAFPHSGWIRLDRDTLDALLRYRSGRGLTSWDETFAALLAPAVQGVP